VAAFVAGVVLASAAGVVAADDPGERTTPEWLTAKVGDALGREGVVTWVPTGDFASSADVRVPRYPFQIEARGIRSLALSAVRGEQVSAQLAVAASHPITGLSATVGGLGTELTSEVRFVRYVPVARSKSELTWSAKIDDVAGEREVSGDRNPDVVGDPLVSRRSVDVPAYAAQPLWFTFQVPADTPPGDYTGTIRLTGNGSTLATYPLWITVEDVTLPAAPSFYLDVWAQPETIAAAAGVQPWSSRHWTLIEAYQRDLATRGQKVVNTTIVTDPWAHDWSLGRKRSQTKTPYGSMVAWRYDGLNFTFDFERFDRYVRTALRAGAGPRIHAYSMLAFHDAEHVTYTDTRTRKTVREDVTLGGTRWQEAWSDFLAAFEAHLRANGWLEQTWLSFDERPLATMTVVRDFVRRAAPAFADRIAVAGSANTAGIANNLSVDWGGIDAMTPEQIDARRTAGKVTTFYVYGSPAHPNTLSYSPAVEARMLPWIAAQRGLDGFLRWSYNSWTADPYTEPVFIFSQGDEYLVYPGENGPTSSIRWEQLREGIEDFELVRAAGPGRDDVKQAMTLATRNLDGRAKDPKDLPQARALLLGALAEGAR
jgi:hypothetical protein